MIDTHCHLLDGSFDNDRKKVIERATSYGVTKIIEISCEPVLWQRSLFLCENYKDIFCAIGIHPNDADKFVDFSGFLANEKVIAVGECGLDYYRNRVDPVRSGTSCPVRDTVSRCDISNRACYDTSNRVDKKTQIAVFEKQLEIVENFKKPVIIHCRQAEEDVCKILAAHKNIKGVIHCFSSSVEFAEKFLQLGFYIGIDGPVTYPNAKVLREVIKILPVEKMLLETDSPYLPPQNFRGKRNEPSYINFIAEKIAEIKEMPVSEILKITDDNAKKLFGI
ncbi:MAG: TatD family hydrolase [Elusimicrobia bacterium]|nr:TatD family hydrolase [Elusimicrobiota bacterium]